MSQRNEGVSFSLHVDTPWTERTMMNGTMNDSLCNPQDNVNKEEIGNTAVCMNGGLR